MIVNTPALHLAISENNCRISFDMNKNITSSGYGGYTKPSNGTDYFSPEIRCEICLKLKVNLANYHPSHSPSQHIQIQIHPLSPQLQAGAPESCLISD